MTSSVRKLPQLDLPSPVQLDRSRPTIGSGKAADRLPPPSLFQGPRSKNASHISLALPGDRADADGQQRSSRPTRMDLLSPSSFRRPSAHSDDFRAESLWAEMQKTLGDVELSAMNSSHAFGEDHEKALEDLRMAQLSLAQAWAKSEADDTLDHDFESEAIEATIGALKTGSSPSKRSKEDSKGALNDNKSLEEETERDIQLARKRREANDRYFQQVSSGVQDVVSKLDEVASAMRRVEKETREIWNESADEQGSMNGSASGTDASPIPETPLETKK